MSGEEAAERGKRTNRGVVTMAMVVVIVILMAGALLTGPVLDEYWTIKLTDLSQGPVKLATQHWMGFTRPPIFNAWATLLSAAGFNSIPIARIISNLPALGLMLFASRRLLDRLPNQARYHAVLILLVLSAGPTLKAFATYRSDFWQLMAFTTQIMITRHIFFVEEDYRRRRDRVIGVIAIVATMGAILLDYIAGLCAVVLTAATILACLAQGRRKWARFLGMTLIVTVIIAAIVAKFQSETWLRTFDSYRSWIQLEEQPTSAIIAMFIVGAIGHNPVALVGGWLERRGWDSHDTGFLVTLGGTVIMSFLLLIEIDAQKNIITTDNAADIALVICAMMAVLGARLFHKRGWVIGLAAYAIFSALLGFFIVGSQKNWQEGAKTIRRVVVECPTTAVYAASGWAMQDRPDSSTAEHERAVFNLGYKELADVQGFPIRLLGRTPVEAIAPGACPTILWIEQVPPWMRMTTDEILSDARLKGLNAAKITVTRTDTGLILRADKR